MKYLNVNYFNDAGKFIKYINFNNMATHINKTNYAKKHTF